MTDTWFYANAERLDFLLPDLGSFATSPDVSMLAEDQAIRGRNETSDFQLRGSIPLERNTLTRKEDSKGKKQNQRDFTYTQKANDMPEKMGKNNETRSHT